MKGEEIAVRRNRVRYFLAVCILFIAILLDRYETTQFYNWIKTNNPLAKNLYSIFVDVDFDFARWNENTEAFDCFKLYYPDNSSVATELMVKRIHVDPTTSKLFQFKKMMRVSNGILFAKDVSANGEWEGIFICRDGFDAVIRKYIIEIIDDNSAYIADIPYFL